jgi:hypothetical protein
MTRWDRINIVLAALICGLAALLWWPASGPSTRGAMLTTLDPQRITSIRIERERLLTLSLQRNGEQWQLHHPLNTIALPHRVGQLLAIASAPVVQHIRGERNDAAFGLDEPTAVLQLDEQRLLFGDHDPTRQYRYVRVDAEIRVIDDIYFQLLTLPANHFAGDGTQAVQ